MISKRKRIALHKGVAATLSHVAPYHATKDMDIDADAPIKMCTIVTGIITKLIRWEFFPVVLRSKITEPIFGELSSGNSLQDFVHGISVRVSSAE